MCEQTTHLPDLPQTCLKPHAAPRGSIRDMTELEERIAAQEAADERATRLFVRIGIISVVVLLAWIGVVVASFR